MKETVSKLMGLRCKEALSIYRGKVKYPQCHTIQSLWYGENAAGKTVCCVEVHQDCFIYKEGPAMIGKPPRLGWRLEEFIPMTRPFCAHCGIEMLEYDPEAHSSFASIQDRLDGISPTHVCEQCEAVKV